jgi:hypothetical protein
MGTGNRGWGMEKGELGKENISGNGEGGIGNREDGWEWRRGELGI